MSRKNPTPRLVALFTSSAIGFFVLFFHVVLIYILDMDSDWRMYVIPPIGVAVISYFVIIYFLKNYIYRKIKLIYKTIRTEKIDPEAKPIKIDPSQNILDEVEKEVGDWAEQQRNELEKFKTWAKYRRNYIGNVAHELKTPIFNIQGYLHTLLEGAINDPEVNKRYIKKAAKNADRLQNIVEDLNTITKLESQTMKLNITSFDIKVLVEEIFEELELKAAKNGVQLVFKKGADENYYIKADRNNIHLAITNLINNAIKYNEEGGEVSVSFYVMDENLLIEVSDNGIGIEPKHIPYLFDRFYRVDKGRDRKRGGSGLGLSIVKHVVEAHNQTINVRSTPGLGTTFGFTLPLVNVNGNKILMF